MTEEEIYEKRTAREILSMIEEICFSQAYVKFRVDNGSRGQILTIIENIKRDYGVG